MHANCVKADPWPHGYEWELNALLCVCALHMRARACLARTKARPKSSPRKVITCLAAVPFDSRQQAEAVSVQYYRDRVQNSYLAYRYYRVSWLMAPRGRPKNSWCLGTFHGAWHKQNCHLQILQEQSSILLQYRKPVETFVCTAPNSQITNFNTVSAVCF